MPVCSIREYEHITLPLLPYEFQKYMNDFQFFNALFQVYLMFPSAEKYHAKSKSYLHNWTYLYMGKQGAFLSHNTALLMYQNTTSALLPLCK